MNNQQLITTTKLAEVLGLSRTAIFNKIKKGEIKALKIGRNYLIPPASLSAALGKTISERQKEEIKTAVKKTVKEYGETLKLLGRE